MVANPLHGQAIAMQYTGFLLHRVTATASGRQALDSLLSDVSDSRGASVVDQTVLGCTWTTNIVTALAVEMALKSLLLMEVGDYRRTHDLLELFDALPPDLASNVRAAHRRLSVSGVPLRDLLELHRHDFVRCGTSTRRSRFWFPISRSYSLPSRRSSSTTGGSGCWAMIRDAALYR